MPGYDERRLGDLRVFDDSFQAISYNADDSDHLQAIEILVSRGDKKYTLGIETYEMHISRIDLQDDQMGENDTLNDPTLVIPAEEILPSDLVSIKQATLEDLLPFLVLQEEE